MVKASADSLLRVINDILDFSKIEAGKLDLDPTDFALRDGLGDALRALALRAHNKGLELAFHIPAQVPDTLVGDPDRLRQVVVNLVGNAIKFTERGEVVLRVDVETRTPAEAWLRFAVTDTGIGIPADKLARIFEPFEQADTSVTRRFGGTGLGLAIAGRLVELMGGRLAVDSTPGQGSTFHFSARFGLQAAGRPGAPAAARVEQLHDVPVLVVDDNHTNRRILEEMLSNWRMRPVVVADAVAARAALAAAAAEGRPFPLVLLDAQMPDVDGYTLAREVAAAGPPRPAIVLLSSSGPQEAGRVRDLPATTFLTKPVKQSDLLRVVQRSLGTRLSDPGTGKPCAAPAEQCLRILLAEDNEVNQRLVVRVLEKRGHRVSVVGTGRAALEALRRAAFDVVLMDVQMPEMGGFEATAALRAAEAGTGRRMPVIAMTAHAMKGDRERCLAAGMDGYVSKPVQTQELLQAIASVVTQSADRTTTEGQVPAPAVVGVDRARLMEQLGGDEELLREVVGLFHQGFARSLAGLRAAMEAGDAARLEREAHSLRGSVAVFGCAPATEMAHQLETQGRAGDLTGAAAVLAELEETLRGLDAALVALVAAAEGKR
jgi:CheY-like chemotaxis protein/HPt (histidine-containing phosphotransfer) domain-containing protein